MTAKEKAKELVDNSYEQLKWALLSHSHKFVLETAKIQVLMAVNEIIELLKRYTSPHEPEYIEGERRGVKFWQQVIGEIKAIK